MPTLLGLDLSLTAAAAVAVPLDWDGDWRRVESTVVGMPLRRDATDAERARRTETIAAQLVAFARAHCVTQAVIEGYAYAATHQAHALGELGGVVRLELVRAGVEIRTVPVASARKLLLGRLPRSGPKLAVCHALRAAGCPSEWGLDELDAFCVANWLLSELGGYCYAQAG